MITAILSVLAASAFAQAPKYGPCNPNDFKGKQITIPIVKEPSLMNTIQISGSIVITDGCTVPLINLVYSQGFRLH